MFRCKRGCGPNLHVATYGAGMVSRSVSSVRESCHKYTTRNGRTGTKELLALVPMFTWIELKPEMSRKLRETLKMQNESED